MSVCKTGTTSTSPCTPDGHGFGCWLLLPGAMCNKMSTTMLGFAFRGFSCLLFPEFSDIFLKFIIIPQSNSSSSFFTCEIQQTNYIKVLYKNYSSIHTKYSNYSTYCTYYCKCIRFYVESEYHMTEAFTAGVMIFIEQFRARWPWSIGVLESWLSMSSSSKVPAPSILSILSPRRFVPGCGRHLQEWSL